MARAPFQVLVLPYRVASDGLREYAVLERADSTAWQGVAGGGEDDESPAEAARREAAEEAGIPSSAAFVALDSMASIPACHFPDATHWGPGTYVVPEHAFGVRVESRELRLSAEHRSFEWLSFDQATSRLSWESNRTALWELEQRLAAGDVQQRAADRQNVRRRDDLQRLESMMQETVAKFLEKSGLRCNPDVRLLDVASEAGELAKEYLLATDYGKGPFRRTDAWVDELGDLLFSVLALAAESETDAKDAVNAAIAKYEDRIQRTGSAGEPGDDAHDG